MGELNTQVLKGFGIRAKRVVREKAYYICDTPEGLRMVSKTPDSDQQIVFQQMVKEHLIQNGYPWVDRFHMAVNGLPYVTLGDERYVMTDFINPSEVNFTDRADFTKTVEAVARWHTCARGITMNSAATSFFQPPSMIESFQKQANELQVIRKRVNRQARLSDFDVLFIKNAGDYAKYIKNAIQLLGNTQYAAARQEALTRGHICHNALKEESLRIDGDDVFVIKYGNAAIDCQINDLCGLIRRYSQRAGNQSIPLHQVLDVYSRVRTLTHEDTDILYALLEFPYPFMKIVSQYYSKKRSWTPNAITNRMQAVVSEKDTYRRYIEASAVTET